MKISGLALVALTALGHVASQATSSAAPNATSPTPGAMNTTDQTILQVLNSTTNGTKALVHLLTSSPDLASIAQMLNSTGNMTVFVPTDAALQQFMGQNSGGQGAGQGGGQGGGQGVNGTSGQNMTMNSTMIGNYTIKDIISYHITQQAVPLNSSINSTIVAGTIATNQTIDKFPQGGLPLIIMNNSTQNATNSSSSGTNVVMNIRLPILNILQPGPTNSSSGNSSSGNGSGSSGNGSANFTVGNGVDNALVTNQSNIMASNGIIHVIDSVLVPPGQLTQVLQNISIAQPIKDMLNQYSQYSTQINQERNVTIFVPNQAGYCASCISSQSQNQLEDLVKSHIVRGIYFSSNFTMGQTTNLTTLDSTQIPVTSNSSGITVNNTITVVQPDILFNGGVIHIINGQLNATASNQTSSENDMEGDD